MNDSIACNIALIPTTSIAQSAIAASKHLERRGGLFALDDLQFFPHVTLYMTYLSEAGVAQANKLLAAIAAQTRAIHAVAVRYGQTRAPSMDRSYIWGYLSWVSTAHASKS